MLMFQHAGTWRRRAVSSGWLFAKVRGDVSLKYIFLHSWWLCYKASGLNFLQTAQNSSLKAWVKYFRWSCSSWGLMFFLVSLFHIGSEEADNGTYFVNSSAYVF